MSVCPLCSNRPAKRFCPATDALICAVCCGTKREIEIDCPSSCPHLKAGREYEADKSVTDRDLLARAAHFDDRFFLQFAAVLDAIVQEVLTERAASSWLVDVDVLEVFKSLVATMKTLSAGIYYESPPDGPVRQSLFRRIKAVLDHAMQPNQELTDSALRPLQAIEVLEFLTISAQINSNLRPKSRQYLDWLGTRFGVPVPTESRGGLILP